MSGGFGKSGSDPDYSPTRDGVARKSGSDPDFRTDVREFVSGSDRMAYQEVLFQSAAREKDL